TKKYEITDFLKPALKGGLFTKRGQIDDIKIVELKDEANNIVEYHGLVRVEPDAAGERIIKKLNKKPIKGKHIIVREYVLRNWRNDRRVRRKDKGNISFPDRRQSDRRRYLDEVSPTVQTTVDFTGIESFQQALR
ncbi:MAG: hypothetical protein ACU84J_08765, partial [Gammaproteobacteria bacterium]